MVHVSMVTPCFVAWRSTTPIAVKPETRLHGATPPSSTLVPLHFVALAGGAHSERAKALLHRYAWRESRRTMATSSSPFGVSALPIAASLPMRARRVWRRTSFGTGQ